MALVKQVRVLRNVVLTGLCCSIVLWFVREHINPNIDALLIGAAAGAAYGLLHWWQLLPKVTRRNRRFERNKIVVSYLDLGEILISAVAYNYYLAIPLVLAALAAVLLGYFSAHWWTVLVGSFGLGGGLVLAGCLVWKERTIGPIYYQYDNAHWQGAEGMLYKTGKVVRQLAPQGLVRVNGELWAAVGMDGASIEVGERIEVLQLDGLILYVDRIPEEEAPRDLPQNVSEQDNEP